MVIKTSASEQNNIWSCPTRNFLPRLEPGSATALAIGYQYLGGLATWRNPAGAIANAPSPVKLGNAKPGWCLAAEANARYLVSIAGAPPGWGADGYVAGQPIRVPHARPKKKHPDGGNILFVDGSARWIKFEQMYFMHSWDPGSARLFSYQEHTNGRWPTLSRKKLTLACAAPSW